MKCGVKHEVYGACVWSKRVQRKETVCAKVLRQEVLECLRNNSKETSEGAAE